MMRVFNVIRAAQWAIDSTASYHKYDLIMKTTSK